MRGAWRHAGSDRTDRSDRHGQTQTAITLTWTPSTDNVGVTGYRSFRDGTQAGTGTAPSYAFSGLTCGTCYTLAVEAYDAVGQPSAGPASPPRRPPCSPTPPPPSDPGPAAANLWVDTNGGSCVRQATPGAYADAQACSWPAAYPAAQSGDLILVKGGSYGNVKMGANKTLDHRRDLPHRRWRERRRQQLRERPHRGAAGVNNSRSSARSRRGPSARQGQQRDRGQLAGGLRRLHQRPDLPPRVGLERRRPELRHQRQHRQQPDLDQRLEPHVREQRIHDAGLRAGSGAHTECMYAWDVTDLTLKRNHFYHCSVMDVFITGSSVSNGGYVENNVFEKPWSSTGRVSNRPAFHFRNGGDPSPDPNNWDFRYNTFVGPLSISRREPGRLRRDAGDRQRLPLDAPCGKGNTTYSNNAFVSGGCGTSAITNPLSTYQAGFTNTGDPGDYSLRSTSVLRDKGNPSLVPVERPSPAARPSGSAPDIGAYEYAGWKPACRGGRVARPPRHGRSSAAPRSGSSSARAPARDGSRRPGRACAGRRRESSVISSHCPFRLPAEREAAVERLARPPRQELEERQLVVRLDRELPVRGLDVVALGDAGYLGGERRLQLWRDVLDHRVREARRRTLRPSNGSCVPSACITVTFGDAEPLRSLSGLGRRRRSGCRVEALEQRAPSPRPRRRSGRSGSTLQSVLEEPYRPRRQRCTVSLPAAHFRSRREIPRPMSVSYQTAAAMSSVRIHGPWPAVAPSAHL